jgi:hypothetical protein
MRIALCFSGHARDLEYTKQFWTSLIEKYNIDVYASLWDIENKELNDTIDNFIQIYNPKKIEVDSYETYKITTGNLAAMHINPPSMLSPMFQSSAKAFGQFPMYYKIWKCNMLTKYDNPYDLVIRARTDIVLDEKFDIVCNEMLNVPMGSNYISYFPYSNGINDCFAYGIPKIMDYYSFIYLQMMQYLNDGHYAFQPEHFLAVHFSKIHIQIRYFANYMMISRASKGTQNEIYNKFVNPAVEDIQWSDWHIYEPNTDINFKKDIRADFVI